MEQNLILTESELFNKAAQNKVPQNAGSSDPEPGYLLMMNMAKSRIKSRQSKKILHMFKNRLNPQETGMNPQKTRMTGMEGALGQSLKYTDPTEHKHENEDNCQVIVA